MLHKQNYENQHIARTYASLLVHQFHATHLAGPVTQSFIHTLTDVLQLTILLFSFAALVIKEKMTEYLVLNKNIKPGYLKTN
ncbi:hypothetical protein C5U38_04170 [Escherichia fergusonii]|nr:hypothetical protein C5U38_04170 [Escherichia fergusonii]